MTAFIFGGKEYDQEPEELDDDLRKRIASEATFLGPDGTPLAGPALRHARIAFGRDAKWGVGSIGSSPGPRRYLIPLLWLLGTFPILGGTKGAGKTHLIIALIASLLTAGRRFLDFFEPADLAADPRHESLYVVVINSETPWQDFEDALRAEGVDPDATWLTIYHLELLGGPELFDLTDPEKYDLWARQLVECEDGCWTPSVVIVDGLSAVLGQTTDRYGPWYAKFRRLMKESDVLSGLVTAHTTQKGDHLMGGQEAVAGADGLWYYTAANQDNPTSQRSFEVRPRLGGAVIKKTPVGLVDGRLVMRPRAERRGEQSSEPHSSTPTPHQTQDALLAFVTAATTPPSARELREGVAGSSSEVDMARDALLASGRLVQEPRQGRGGGYAYRVAPGETNVSK